MATGLFLEPPPTVALPKPRRFIGARGWAVDGRLVSRPRLLRALVECLEPEETTLVLGLLVYDLDPAIVALAGAVRDWVAADDQLWAFAWVWRCVTERRVYQSPNTLLHGIDQRFSMHQIGTLLEDLRERIRADIHVLQRDLGLPERMMPAALTNLTAATGYDGWLSAEELLPEPPSKRRRHRRRRRR